MRLYKITITETAEYVYYMRAKSNASARKMAEADFLANITLGGHCKSVEVFDRLAYAELVP